MMVARVKSWLRAPTKAASALEALVAGSANQQSILQMQLSSLNQRLDAIVNALGRLTDELSPGPANEQLRTDVSLTNERLGRISRPPQTSHAARLELKGFVVLREFLDQQEIQDLNVLVSESYRLMAAANELTPADFERNFHLWNGVWLEGLPSFLKSVPTLGQKYAQIIPLIEELTRRSFGPEWHLYPFRSYFRRHVGMAKKVPWHIDADAADIQRHQCFNVWLPLDAVGQGLPSLDVVPYSHNSMRKVPLLDGENRYREDEYVSEIGQSYTPILEPGDALVFDQFTLHRTQCVGGQETVRTACEFRFERW